MHNLMINYPSSVSLTLKFKEKGENIMKKYVCTVCGYIYDPEVGEESANVAAGTAWEDVPEDFLCPLCGVGKDQFEPSEE